MTEPWRTLCRIAINGGSIGLDLYPRDYFAELEARGWMQYVRGNVYDHMRITAAGYAEIGRGLDA